MADAPMRVQCQALCPVFLAECCPGQYIGSLTPRPGDCCHAMTHTAGPLEWVRTSREFCTPGATEIPLEAAVLTAPRGTTQPRRQQEALNVHQISGWHSHSCRFRNSGEKANRINAVFSPERSLRRPRKHNIPMLPLGGDAISFYSLLRNSQSRSPPVSTSACAFAASAREREIDYSGASEMLPTSYQTCSTSWANTGSRRRCMTAHASLFA